jgi:hypothetical protein
MNAPKRPRGKKYFSPAQANATLPLVRAIVKDIAELAFQLRAQQERLELLEQGNPNPGSKPEAQKEELAMLQAELDLSQERMREFLQELTALGVELKDFFTGLVDFPARRGGRDIYLCWKLGEAEVAYWHERDAGFAGRQKLKAEEVRSQKS